MFFKSNKCTVWTKVSCDFKLVVSLLLHFTLTSKSGLVRLDVLTLYAINVFFKEINKSLNKCTEWTNFLLQTICF